MRRSLPSLSLVALCALVSLGASGCSSSGEWLGPTPGAPDDDGNLDGSDPSGAAESSGDAGDESGSETGEEPGGPVPEPEPDDDGRGYAPAEPEAACDVEADVSQWLSPEDSNSMASPVLVREAVLGDEGSVQSVAIRTWEFFNYYGFGYPAADPGSLALSPSLVQPEGAPAGEFLLQVGVSSEALDAQVRAPMSVTLVLDTSGSMEGDAMDMLKASGFAIASSLQPGDVVSVVTWSTENAVVLAGHPVTGPDDPELLAELDGLTASGINDLHAGLVAGYDLAQQTFVTGGTNRVVLVTNGGVNADVADLDLIADKSAAGIDLVGVGVGDAATYRDDLVDAVTDAGKGASVFIASAEEAQATFHDRFVSTMAVAARNVQLRLDMPPGFELVSDGGDEESMDIGDVEPQHLAPNDAMVFHQRIRTCAPLMLTQDMEITVTAIWIDVLTLKPRQVQRVLTLAELLATDPAPLYKGAAVLAYAEGLKAYKHADSDGRIQTMNGAFEALAQAETALPDDPELAEIRQVLEALTE